MELNNEVDQKSDIDFVYFDLGNILYSFDPRKACQNVAQRYGVDASAVNSAVYETGLQADFESGQIRQEFFVQQVCLNLGFSEKNVVSQDLLDCLSNMFSPIRSMLVAVEHVRASGCSIGVLSNTCRSHWDWINRIATCETLKAFDAYILSFEVGVMKPNAAIYDAAEQAAEVPVERILFLDDRQENIDMAVSRGWQAHRCIGGEDAETVLEAFGFRVTQ